MEFVPCGHSGAPIAGMNVARHEATRHQVEDGLVIIFRQNRRRKSKKKSVRSPGIGPGAKAWEASMLPLHHERWFSVQKVKNI